MASFIPGELFAGIGGNREIKDGYARIDGAWRKIFSGVNWVFYEYHFFTSQGSGYAQYNTDNGYPTFIAYVNLNSSSEDQSSQQNYGMQIPTNAGDAISADLTVRANEWSGSGYSQIRMTFIRADGSTIQNNILPMTGEPGNQDIPINSWNRTAPNGTAYVIIYASAAVGARNWNARTTMSVRAVRINGVEQSLT